MHSRNALNKYYANPIVRARLVEFLGGTSLDGATSAFITTNGTNHVWYAPRPVYDLWQCLREGSEVARSLWDRKSLLAHLDVEYVNFDFPEEPYLEPRRVFGLQRPVVRAIQQILLQSGIFPLHLLSGRGHHFVWRIPLDSPAFARLAVIGHRSDTLMNRYAQPQPPTGEIVSPDLGAAFCGLGQVLEFLAHQVLDIASSQCEIPIELTAVEAGPNLHGREVVSIDLSEYGDPLYTRSTRMPFSAYLKAQRAARIPKSADLPPLFMIPLFEMDEEAGLLAMRDMGEVVDLAQRASVDIPDQSAGMAQLINHYEQSSLARFHSYFYQANHDAPADWPHTYDRTPLDTLPRCARTILEHPNDLLLKPAGIQHVARVLLAAEWHPRHIAGLIRSKYERNYGWGDQWYLYDAATRADFYTRLFAGLFAVGRDPLIDFNCRSTQEKGYCPTSDCRQSLAPLHHILLNGKAAQAFVLPLSTEGSSHE